MREKDDQITVAVAVYNSANYLKKCLGSICEQTYRNLEVLMVVDGEMKDESENICREYEKKDKRFRTIKIEHAGLPEVRNVGVKESKGKYIAFIDGDDWVEPDTYEKMYAAITDSNADMVISAYYLEIKNKVYIKGQLKQKELSSYEMLKGVVSGNIDNFMWNKMYRTELFSDIHFLTNMMVDDMSVMHLLADKCNHVAVVNTPQNHYIKHKGSIITNRNYKTRLDILELLMLQHRYISSKHPELCRNMANNIYYGYVSMCVASVLSKKDERKKYNNLRTLVDEYFSNFEDDFKCGLDPWQYNNLMRMWKNSLVMDCFSIVTESLGRVFAGKGIRRI